MPELPEVETIRRELEPLLRGRTILCVKISRKDIVGFPDVADFVQQAADSRIVGLGRRGKYLFLYGQKNGGHFDIIVHLRLSGHLCVVPSQTAPMRFERIRFVLSGGRSLVFNEPRVLGRVYLVRERATPSAGRVGEIKKGHRERSPMPNGRWQMAKPRPTRLSGLPPVLKGLEQMGLEPIDAGFSGEYLRDKLRNRKACVKGLLLDQRITAGIGNIYSDEALFRAGIRPLRPAGKVTVEECTRLARALRRVLEDGIKHMGTTMADSRYRRPDNTPGEFQKMLMVFDREGKPCKVCGTTIRSAKVGSRTTRFCPRCQK